eukprot:129217_1
MSLLLFAWLCSVLVSIDTQSAQRVAHKSGIGWFFNDVGVDATKREEWKTITKETIAKCDTYNNFVLDTIQLYARPIQTIGVHDTYNDENDRQQNKKNANKAAMGLHHALLKISGGHPEPLEYVLDRVDAVRFVKLNSTLKDELSSGHLKLIKQYNNSSIKYEHIRTLILNEIDEAYNLVDNNCLHFAYKFIDEIMKRNEWNNFSNFWRYIA